MFSLMLRLQGNKYLVLVFLLIKRRGRRAYVSVNSDILAAQAAVATAKTSKNEEKVLDLDLKLLSLRRQFHKSICLRWFLLPRIMADTGYRIQLVFGGEPSVATRSNVTPNGRVQATLLLARKRQQQEWQAARQGD